MAGGADKRRTFGWGLTHSTRSDRCFGVFALPVDDASRQYVPLLHMNKERVFIYVVNALNTYVLVILYLGLNESEANSC